MKHKSVYATLLLPSRSARPACHESCFVPDEVPSKTPELTAHLTTAERAGQTDHVISRSGMQEQEKAEQAVCSSLGLLSQLHHLYAEQGTLEKTASKA